MNAKQIGGPIDRRSFLSSTAIAGSGLVLSKKVSSRAADSKEEDLNIALVGAGEQGQRLLKTCVKIPGIRVKAICDIWTSFNLKRASSYLTRYRHEHKSYSDFKEMVQGEKDLDAVIIATPDFCHVPQTVACLKTGWHVYCESPMSNTIEGAQRMLKAASESGKLLQIGFQRRSNPKYLHSCWKLLREVKLLGRITTVNGQWNRAVEPGRGWPRRAPVDPVTLEKNGFSSMYNFRNWLWYKGLGGGPLAFFGSHQIDVFNWFLGCTPASVMASGGTDYYSKKTHQLADSVMALLEYQAKTGVVRAFYQTISTNSNLGDFEKILGDKGSLIISESAAMVNVYREQSVSDWDRWVNLDYLSRSGKKKKEGDDKTVLDVTETVKPALYTIPVTYTDSPYKPHLENFFDSIRGKVKLNCPGEIGHKTVLVISKINEALEAEKKIYLRR